MGIRRYKSLNFILNFCFSSGENFIVKLRSYAWVKWVTREQVVPRQSIEGSVKQKTGEKAD